MYNGGIEKLIRNKRFSGSKFHKEVFMSCRKADIFAGFVLLVGATFFYAFTGHVLNQWPSGHPGEWAVFITGNTLVYGCLFVGCGFVFAALRHERPMPVWMKYYLVALLAFGMAAALFVFTPPNPEIYRSYWFASLVCAAAGGGIFARGRGEAKAARKESTTTSY